MRYRTLGWTGLVVSRLSLGTMTFGVREKTRIATIDQPSATRIVGRALDAGINWFDSAPTYGDGQSEVLLGAALGSRRDEAVITTKVGARTGSGYNRQGLSRRHVFASIEESLRRLGTDHVDLVLAHFADPATGLDETLEALDRLVEDGKARYIGISNWSAWQLGTAAERQRATGRVRLACAQQYYNLLCRDIEHELIPCATFHDIGLTVWSPLAMGLLTGRYRADDHDGSDGRLAEARGLSRMLPHDREQLYALLSYLDGLAAAHGVPVATVSLAWLLARPVVDSVILGVSSEHQLDDALRAVDLDLTTAELTELEQLTRPPIPYPLWLPAPNGDERIRTLYGGERVSSLPVRP
jgi:aryl-alcohol dehydrogenase-like predicted oxidoreductase